MNLARQKFKRLMEEKYAWHFESGIAAQLQISLHMKIIFRDRFMEIGVCIRVIGNLSMIPDDLHKLVAEVMTITSKNDKAFLNLAFPYACKYNLCKLFIYVHIQRYILR